MKKQLFILFSISFILGGCMENTISHPDLRLWYSEPAQEWVEALPVGNGRLGGMVFGHPGKELIQLNEESLWSGGPADLNPNPEAPKYLPLIREALAKGDYAKAEQLAKKMQGNYTQSYEPLGDLEIKLCGMGEVTGYYRDLNLENALSTTRFTSNGVTYKREVFVSHPDQVMVIRISADKKAQINLSVALSSQLNYGIAALN